MAAVQSYFGPVLLLMSSLQETMLNIGAIFLFQTKVNLQGAYAGLQARATDAYEDVRRRASSVYEDFQVKVGGRYLVAQNRTSETCQRWLNRINLVCIQCQLRLNLALHNFQFQLSLLCNDTRKLLALKLHQLIGVPFKNALKKIDFMNKWTRLKFMKLKKAAADSVKDSLDRMTLKAKEYEDVLDEKLTKVTRSPSRKQLVNGQQF
ncbi:hypothetical protein SK128_028431 [Halocaridina rubra]|uniref:Uncharacterized protein n=1 Tax=Halocaridina rubra TaxID=373956 RepID=A0AAN8ZWM6_HALRR